MSISRIPGGPHWAIVSETSAHIPGDERSRTNPGHGYPAHTETFITYEAFTSKEDWEAEIERRTLQKYGEPFRALRVEVAHVKIQVSTN